MMRCRNEGFETSGKDNQYGILQNNLTILWRKPAMKSLFEQNGGTYRQESDYLIPNLALPAEKESKSIGIWGQRHLRFIRQHKRIFYTKLLTSGKLNSYLADIDKQAEAMFSRLATEMAEQQGMTEQLKAENQMAWVQKMNNIQNCANEIINAELMHL